MVWFVTFYLFEITTYYFETKTFSADSLLGNGRCWPEFILYLEQIVAGIQRSN